MPQSFKRLGAILCAFVALAMSSLACEEMDQMTNGFNNHHPTPMAKEWVPPSQQNLTIEQQNALLKFVEFSVGGGLPEGQEIALILDDGEGSPVIVGRLEADEEINVSLEANQRAGISVRVRAEGSDDEWETLRSLAPIKQGAALRLQFSEGGVKVGIGNKGK